MRPLSKKDLDKLTEYLPNNVIKFCKLEIKKECSGIFTWLLDIEDKISELQARVLEIEE
jgi:hypothetical protein